MPRVYKDLAAAGIPKMDAEGRVFDFHALRGTFATMLATNGVDVRQTMALMRHSQERLTTQVYQDAGHLKLRDAVNRLPGDTLIDTLDPSKTGKKRSWQDLDWMSPEEWEIVPPEGYTYEESQLLLGSKLHEMVRAAGFEPAAPAV